MTRWRELAEKRRQVQGSGAPYQQEFNNGQLADKQMQPQSPSAATVSPASDTLVPKVSKMPKTRSGNSFGEFGKFDTGGWHQKGTAIPDLLALWPYALTDGPEPDQLPDLSDLLERVSILEADGMPRHLADAQVLAEAGYTSWDALAAAWRNAIGLCVVALPPRGMPGLSSKYLARLIAVTGEFCGSLYFPAALACGWSLEDLFSVNPVAPLVRVDCWGLVPGIALSTIPARVVTIDRDAAEMRCASGAMQRFYRSLSDGAILWWRLA